MSLFAKFAVFLGSLTAAGAAMAADNRLLPSPQPQSENSVSITQFGKGNWVQIRQKSSEDEQSTTVEQDITDENGNRAIVSQQGNNNALDLTQQSRFNNVITNGSVLPSAPAGTPTDTPSVEQFGNRVGTGYSVQSAPAAR